ncbi:serine threonine-protein kinase [Musa troglodytarum]|uniref:Serine threonine-protein kinase n=1 Tax=Musa troglodytarum TaxID=320322 RepID=A0A9E7EQE0_9LILI|nr:serine threonine-protein kinase [Musa troglodytarum]
MDPFVWTLCTDVEEENRIPSIESLKTVHPCDSSIEVALVDRQYDPNLRQLQNMVAGLSCSCVTPKDMVVQLSKPCLLHMGGTALMRMIFFVTGKSAVRLSRLLQVLLCFQLGSYQLVSAGIALLFKMLADTINLPCRVAKGCKYCKTGDASSCLVRFGLEREYLVDLIRNPGNLCEPDSLLNGPYSISISSPLRLQQPNQLRTLAKQYLLDCQSLNLFFNDASTGAVVAQGDVVDLSSSRPLDEKSVEVISSPLEATRTELCELPLPHIQEVSARAIKSCA